MKHAYPFGRWRQEDQGEKEEKRKKERKERGKEGVWAGVRNGAEEALKCTTEVWGDGPMVKSACCSPRTELWFPASMQNIKPPVAFAPEDTTPSSDLPWHCT